MTETETKLKVYKFVKNNWNTEGDKLKQNLSSRKKKHALC